ncbi:hypothetical protein ID866_2859 [Astraeus odoratus]|nr:hypothetical protein ID866_2859 [Astraeus odoratus]
MSLAHEKESSPLSGSRPLTDLNSPIAFPPFRALPKEYDLSETYSPSSKPQRHWCFLGQIVSSSVLVRLMLEVEDREGNRVLVAFHTDDRGAMIRDLCKRGHTIAVLYATQHTFAFSPPGLRLEEDVHIKIFPYPLHQMLEVSGELCDKAKGKRCDTCGTMDASLKLCTACKGAWYCSKACQTNGWKAHKQKCPVIRDVQWFTRKNWENHAYPYFFPIRRRGWQVSQHY